MGPYDFGMPAWIGDGEIYCEDCKDDDCDGPYPHGGGESDSPTHCAGCGLFLENPLTDEGLIYVARGIRRCLNHAYNFKLSEIGVPDQWRTFYAGQLPDLVWPWPEKGEHHYADCIYKEDLPEECIDACSGPGRKDLPIKLWRYALGFIVDVDRARGTLTRYGIEDAGTMSAGTLAEYILWLACGDFAEYEGEDSACGSDFFGLGE